MTAGFSRDGFTFTELVVVSAVAAVLGALILPAVSGAREQNKAAACIGNLNTLGRAVLAYAEDYSGYVPVYSRYKVSYRPTVRIFCVEGYLRRLDKWVCPSIYPYRWSPGRSLLENTNHYAVPRAQAEGNLPGYMWEAVSHVDPGDLNSEAFVVLDRIKDPSEYPFISEFSDVRSRAQVGDWFYSQAYVKPHMRHGGRSNILFTDGSVEPCGIGKMRRIEISDSAWSPGFDEISFGR